MTVTYAGGDTIEGLIPFGPLPAGKFTKDTDLLLDLVDGARPLLGIDELSVVGRVKTFDLDPQLGLFIKAELDRSYDYRRALLALLEKEALDVAIGSVGHLQRRDRQGSLTTYPWIASALTMASETAGRSWSMKSAQAVDNVLAVGSRFRDLRQVELERLRRDNLVELQRITAENKGRRLKTYYDRLWRENSRGGYN